MAENKGPKEVVELKKSDEGGHAVDAPKTATTEKALKLLKGGVEAGAARQAEKQEIAGQKVIEPLRAYNNLQEALKLVRGYFGKNLRIDLNDIQFRKFHGHMVGESTKEGTYVDPIMLMHPAVRLAHVIGHELAHKNKKVMNEALVEGYVHLFFGHDDAKHGYEKAVGKFEEFAGKFEKNGDMKKIAARIYELYYTGRFEEIYQQYKKNYIDGLKSEKDKDKAFKLFGEVFPELHYVENGKFEMKHVKDFEKEGAKVEEHGEKDGVGNDGKGAGVKSAEVISMDEFRKKVAETERNVKKTGTEG